VNSNHIFIAFSLALLFTQTGTSQVAPGSNLAFALRVYQEVGASRIDWMGIAPPSRQPVKWGDVEKVPCMATQDSHVSTERSALAQSSIDGNGKLLTWSADQTLFAYVARDATIPPPKPNPWGCTDCFYSVLKVVRANDRQVLSTIPLPQFGDHWNYATSIKWSPDGKTLLVGSEAGPSDSKYETYWLLDWTTRKWRYAGGGNAAKWSPDSSQVLWAAARTLKSLGKIHVWVVPLVLLDVQSLEQNALTSGTSYVSDFYWCSK
jgi:WD40 repeat protein